MRGRIHLFFVAPAVLAALVVAGCSSSAKSNAGGTGAALGSSAAADSASSVAGSTTASSAAAAVTTSAASSSGTLDGVPKACPTADLVMSKLQLSSLVLDGPDPSLCRYEFNGDKTKPYAVATFNSAPGLTAAAFEAGLRSGQANVEPVAGVADSAFSFSGDNGGVGLSFLSGATVVSIFTTVPTTTANEVALAQVLLGG